MNRTPQLEGDSTAVLVIDMQERLLGAMHRKVAESHVKNLETLLRGAVALDLPIVISEQYPQGLGGTVDRVREAAGEVTPLAKTSFSCWQDPEIKKAMEDTGRKTWLVAGMETHVCVYLTVRDMVAAGLSVSVLTDCCLSRHRHHYKNGLEMCGEAGAQRSNVETALFELVGGKDHPAFKEISKLVR